VGEWVTTDEVYGAILERRPYAVRGLVGFGANLLLAHADVNRGRAALKALDFYVHADLFMNPTAELADIVWPVATPFEREGLKIGFEVSPEAQSLVQLRHRVVEPRAEARSDTEIVFDLACRLGLGAPYPPNGHSGAPTVGERADKPASGVDPYAGRPDGVCPGGAPPRQFNLVAIQLTIQRTRLGQTDPNRRYLIAATSSGMTDDIGTSIGNIVPDALLGAPPNGTIFERMSDAGISWIDYNSSFPTGATMELYPSVDGKYSETNAKPIAQFFGDAQAGKLPGFSLLDPDYGTQSQEDPQNIIVGEAFLAFAAIEEGGGLDARLESGLTAAVLGQQLRRLFVERQTQLQPRRSVFPGQDKMAALGLFHAFDPRGSVGDPQRGGQMVQGIGALIDRPTQLQVREEVGGRLAQQDGGAEGVLLRRLSDAC